MRFRFARWEAAGLKGNMLAWGRLLYEFQKKIRVLLYYMYLKVPCSQDRHTGEENSNALAQSPEHPAS